MNRAAVHRAAEQKTAQLMALGVLEEDAAVDAQHKARVLREQAEAQRDAARAMREQAEAEREFLANVAASNAERMETAQLEQQLLGDIERRALVQRQMAVADEKDAAALAALTVRLDAAGAAMDE